jgi:hypothetical protein
MNRQWIQDLPREYGYKDETPSVPYGILRDIRDAMLTCPTEELLIHMKRLVVEQSASRCTYVFYFGV